MKRNTLYTRNTLYILGGLAVALALFSYKKSRRQKITRQNISSDTVIGLDENKVQGESIPILPNTLQGAVGSIFGFLTAYNDYEVVTKNTKLNVRERPDGESKIITSLPKGSKIKGKASGTKGWFDVSQDGKKNFGFVASEFLRAIPKS